MKLAQSVAIPPARWELLLRPVVQAQADSAKVGCWLKVWECQVAPAFRPVLLVSEGGCSRAHLEKAASLDTFE